MQDVSILRFLGWIAIVSGACVDDTSFNIGYGDCSTYAAGGRNRNFCAADGAVTKCLLSCGSCGGPPAGIPLNGQCMTNGGNMCAQGLSCQSRTASAMYGTCQSGAITCGVFEMLTQCGSGCEQKCPNENTPLNNMGCACATGYARLNGQCVPLNQCPQAQQPNPTQNAPPTPAKFSPNVNGVVGTKTCSTHAMCGTQNYCFGCTKCFLAVGYANSKTMCGACYANPLAPLPSNCAPIASCASRQDSIDGQCPNWGNAPTCGANEVYMACASACEPVCGQPDAQCNTACAPGKCQCLPGYRRLGNQCVLPYACPSPAPTCGTNEVFLQCSSLCEQTCGKTGVLCAALCGPPKCQCASGYFRSGSSGCVLPYECPVGSGTPAPTCGQNEVYMVCSSLCEPQCGQTDSVCTTACGAPKCQCMPGTVRSGSQCVYPSGCPQAGPGAPPDVHLCAGQNEEWKQCASSCEPKCGEQVPPACNKACAPSACQCKNGYQRLGALCVPASQCPVSCLQDNACVLYCPQGKVTDSNGCALCQCKTSSTPQDPCTPNPCPATQSCLPSSFNCNTLPCQKYTCVGKVGGKPQGATCISSTECQSAHICYMGPFASMGLCLPGSG